MNIASINIVQLAPSNAALVQRVVDLCYKYERAVAS